MPLPIVKAACDPFQELRSRCGGESEEFLARLDIIRHKAEVVWEVPKLSWFTRHGVTHSDSLARLIGEAIAHLQTTPRYLDCGELYVLLAASYLHDVGMQFLDLGKSIDELNRADHDEIRRSHPTVGRQLIIERSKARSRDQFDVTIEDDDFLLPIALVSEAHGTETYADAIDALTRARPQPRGVPFRGDLLGSLLLMVDELDIQRSRATFPKEAELSIVSMAHHLINHYVSAVRVADGDTPKERRVRIDMLFPTGSGDYSGDVRELILAKILKQSHLTNPVVKKRTNGEMEWDSRIAVYEAVDTVAALRTPEAAVRRFFRREVLEKRLVGRAEALATFDGLLSKNAAPVVVDLISLDDTGTEVSLLFQWLAVAAAERGYISAHVAPAVVHAGHGPSGVLELIARQLELPQSDDVAELVLAIKTLKRPVLLTVEELEDAPDEARRIIEQLAVDLPGVSVLSVRDSSGVAASTVALYPIAEARIRDHLMSRLGYSRDDARNRARALYAATAGRAGHLMLSLYADFEAAIIELRE